jgi:hypothetical protein
MVLPPLWSSVDFLRLMGVKTTQALAWEWISRNVMLGTRVVSEAKSLELPPERYAVESVTTLADLDLTRAGTGAPGIVIMSSEAWRGGEDASQGGIPASHQALFARARSVNSFLPKRDRPGPKIYVLVMNR